MVELRRSPGESQFAIRAEDGVCLILVQGEFLNLELQGYMDEYLLRPMEVLGGRVSDTVHDRQPDIDCGHHLLL